MALGNVPHRTYMNCRDDLPIKTNLYNRMLAEAIPQWSMYTSLPCLSIIRDSVMLLSYTILSSLIVISKRMSWLRLWTFIPKPDLVTYADINFNSSGTSMSQIELVRMQENYECDLDGCPAGSDGLHPNALGKKNNPKYIHCSINRFFVEQSNFENNSRGLHQI